MDKRIKQIKIAYADGEEKTVDKGIITTVCNSMMITESVGMSEGEISFTLAGISLFGRGFKNSHLN